MAFPITRTVLVVDDDENFRMALRELLEQRGIVVRAADDATAAIREIDAGKVDVVFTDIRMPGGGFGVLQRVRESRMPMPVIFITGATSPEWRARADAEGAFAYLTKPVGREDILAVLQRAFERGRGPADILARQAVAGRQAQSAQRG